MPSASRTVLACLLLLLAAVALACGDDDDGGDDSSPTRTSAASRTASPSPGGSDEKTPGPDESPDGGETPVNTASPPPTGTGGTPAPRIQDVTAFFAQFPSPPEDERLCAYNLGTRLIDCSDRGVFAPDPPPVGQGTECYLMVSGGNPAALRCQVAEPQGTFYYDARG